MQDGHSGAAWQLKALRKKTKKPIFHGFTFVDKKW